MFETVVGVPFTVYVNDHGPVPVKSTPKLREIPKPHNDELFVKIAVGNGFTVKRALVLLVVPHELVA